MSIAEKIAMSGLSITAIGLIAVLITMVWQIRAWVKQAKLQNFIEYTKRYQEIMLNLPERIYSSSYDIKTIDKKEKEKELRYIRAYYDLCSEEHWLNSQGYIDEKVWFFWKSGMKETFNIKAFRKAWEILLEDTYSQNKEFVKFVSDMHIQVDD